MKLSGLRCVLEVHRCGNHISAAAEALHTSQPGISKQIQQIEAEIGFPVFQRKRNRVVGLTEPGREVIAIAQRMDKEDFAVAPMPKEKAMKRRPRSGQVAGTTSHFD